MTTSDYEYRDGAVWSLKSGRMVAEVTGAGTLKMCAGMASRRRSAEAWFAGLGDVPLPDEPAMPAPAESGTVAPAALSAALPAGADSALLYVGAVPAPAAPALPESADDPESVDDWTVRDIPAAELPPFLPEQGVNTPGFTEFCSRHHLTNRQRGYLLERLEKIARGKKEKFL